jgi:hypothetical protein
MFDAFDWAIRLWMVRLFISKQFAPQAAQRMRVIFDAFACITIGLFRK